FQNFNPEAQRSIMAMIDARVVQNSIISMTDYDSSTGAQTTTYGNVNGEWNIRAMNMVSFPFRNKKWTFNNHLMLYFANSIGYNNGLRNRSESFMFNISPGIAFRPDNFEVEIRPRYSLQNVHNTVQITGNRTVNTYGGDLYLSYTLPIGVTLNTDLAYSATRGYSAGFDENRWLWNASLSYSMLRNRSLTLSLKAYDLLNQQSNIRRNVTANYIDDTSTNSLGRYVMLTLSYKFNTFGSGSMPSDRNAPRHGPGGPPPGAPRGGRPPF
ncbi:MAG: outer membrane beta-barrel family protein, partial [Muribaculaceae bacterium]|nr:outer membrane beta-barrel family protein [Muribaculaceae bacterium]